MDVARQIKATTVKIADNVGMEKRLAGVERRDSSSQFEHVSPSAVRYCATGRQLPRFSFDSVLQHADHNKHGGETMDAYGPVFLDGQIQRENAGLLAFDKF